MARRGKDGVLQINTSGDSTAPVWQDCPIVKDVTINSEAATIENPCRGDGKYAGTLLGDIDFSIEFDIGHEPDDPCWQFLNAARLACEPVHIRECDGDPAGIVGESVTCWEMTGIIGNFTENRGQGDPMVDNISITPSTVGIPANNPRILPTQTIIPPL
jgi:hypothetical protein